MAEVTQTPRGWYDIGNGRAGLWDGTGWTGERVTHDLLRAIMAPVHTNPIPLAPVSPPPPNAGTSAAFEGQPPDVPIPRRQRLPLIARAWVTANRERRFGGLQLRRLRLGYNIQ